MRLLLFSLAMLAALGPAGAAAQAAPTCQFVLGFQALHNLVPATVGSCLEDENHNPANGDALQHTTGGLLVWRKADNWTAFTDGNRTWVNGPDGLQERLNSQRFAWEANPDSLPVVGSAPPTAVARCHTAGLNAEILGTDAGAGNRYTTVGLINRTAQSCSFYGYPGLQMLDAQGRPVPTRTLRQANLVPNEPGAQTVVVQPGGTAFFVFHWEVIPVGAETICPAASALEVTPPDEFAFLVVPMQLNPCGGGTLDVSPVVPRRFP